MRPRLNTLLLFLVAAIVVIVDQATKRWIVQYFADGTKGYIWLIPNRVDINYTQNRGAAFGLFANQTILFIFIAIAVIAMILIYHRYLTTNRLLLKISLGLLLGGAMGNLIDRLRLGYVVDFFEIRGWPVFNVADSCIVVGVTVIAWYLLTSNQGEHVSTTTDTPEVTTPPSVTPE